MKELKLTDTELEVVDEYIFRRAMKLEDLGLTDSKCYPILMRVHNKIEKLKKDKKGVYK